MQTGYDFDGEAPQPKTAAATSQLPDGFAEAVLAADDADLRSVYADALVLQRHAEASGALDAADAALSILHAEVNRRGLQVAAASGFASEFEGNGLLHALWIKFRNWLIGHNGYYDSNLDAFASRQPKEGTPVNFAQKEASLLQQMASAPTPERQRELAHELVALRHDRTAAAQAEREIDLGAAVVTDLMAPVVTAAHHTMATDWMGADPAPVADEVIQSAMATAASRFYLSTSDEVRADAEEFQIQASGMANMVAGQYGERAAAAADAFVRHATFLNREPGAEAQPRTAGLGVNPTVTPLVTKQAAWGADEDDEDEGAPPCDNCGVRPRANQSFTCEQCQAEGRKGKTAADADINPYPAHEQAGYAESGLPESVPVEGYEDEGVVGDKGQEVAPENAQAVQEEGERTPMPGAGESVPGVTSALDAGFRSFSNEFAASILAQASTPMSVTAADGTRPLYEIAAEISRDWGNVYFGAVPYLDAMSSLDSITDRYGADDGAMIVSYFLSNASSWRGDTARRVKAELKALLQASKRGSLDKEGASPAWLDERNNDGYGTPPNHPFWGPGGRGQNFEEVNGWRIFQADDGLWYGHKMNQNAWSTGRPTKEDILEMAAPENQFDVWSSKTAGTDPEDQNGQAESQLPTPEKDTTTAWPWELPEGDVQTGQDASSVAAVPTPGGESGYPQPKKSALVSDPDRLAAFRAACQK